MPTVIVTDEQTGPSGSVDDVPTAEADSGVPVTVYVVVEGMRTSDGRFITPGSLTHRALPLPILGMRTNTESGHTGAEVFGRLDTLVRVPGPELVNRQTGQPFDDGTFVWVGTGSVRADADLTADMRAGYLTGNSVDLSECEYEIIWNDDPNDEDVLAEVDEIRFTSGVIAGTTVCPFPAFAEAYIEIDGQTITPAADRPADDYPLVASVVMHDDPADSLTASVSVDDLPPAEWFTDPELAGPTRPRIDDDGRIVGHLAVWGVAHVGFDGREVYAPRTRRGYSDFMLYDTPARGGDGSRIDVAFGHLTMGGGHADTGLSSTAAAAHYDDAATRVARVAIGEDEHGVWISGQVRPELTLRQRRDLAESQVSGDWRRIGGGLELIAALAVNAPGFPVPREMVASGATYALVAAGVPRQAAGAVVLDYDTLADAIADRLDARKVRATAAAELQARHRAAGLSLRRAAAAELLR